MNPGPTPDCGYNESGTGFMPARADAFRRPANPEPGTRNLRGMAMYAVTIELDFCYGHRLMDYVGKCMHPHGHNGRVQIEVQAPGLDRRGMVYDFGDVKAAIRGWADKELDHKMILRRGDPMPAGLQPMGGPCLVLEMNPPPGGVA